MGKKVVLGTIKQGRIKIYSEKQMHYLHMEHIDHTHYVYKNGKLVKKVRHGENYE
jgi:hypothetical protein